MVAGFNFSENGKFEFFYSYGAVDRRATGSFSVDGKIVRLRSDKEPGKDFTVTRESKEGKGYSISFDHPNQYLLNHIRVIFFVGEERHETFTDNKGRINVDLSSCDKIFVQHTLYPDIVTLIKDKDNNYNQFELTLNPSLEQVSFKGIDFTIAGDSVITCMPNYFIEMTDIEFVKE